MQQSFFIILLFLVTTSCNVHQRTSQTFDIELKNGEVKKRGKISTKKSTKADQFSYYRRWDNEFIEYHENGEIKSIQISHFKVGTYGRPCRELLHKYTEYNHKGVKIYQSKDVCDCKKSVEIDYNKKGKILNKKILKVKRLK